MEALSYLLLAIIVAYGYSAYRFRERRHRVEIATIRGGGMPPGESPMSALFRVITAGFMAVLLLYIVGCLMIMAHRLGHYATPMYGLAAIALLLFGIVAMIFVDAWRHFRSGSDQGGAR